MSQTAKLLFLGTGGSMGVPVIGCKCPVCRSTLQENQRFRPSCLLTIGEKKILIDCSPDYRSQALKYGIAELDGVILTHAHQDHTGGIDDLRMNYMRTKKPIPLLMSKETEQDVTARYDYIFGGHKKKSLVAKFSVETLPGLRGELVFQGIKLQYMTYKQAGMAVNGFRFGDLAYVSDIRDFPETIYEDLSGIKTLIISALRHESTHIHFGVDEAVAFGKRVGAEKVWLTHIAHEMDHEKENAILPENVRLAYDGLEISFELP